MFQNESTEPLTTNKSHDNSKSKEINEIHYSQTSSSTQRPEDESDAFENSQKRPPTVNRKRKLLQSSSSSIANTKQSARLAAKRVRLV